MPKFTLYNGKLRLNGSVLNEIPLNGVTAPEVDVLRRLHGDDAVIELKTAGKIDREHSEERERIENLYAGETANMEGQAKKKKAMLVELFGNSRLPLPTSLEEVAEAKEEAAAEPPARPVRTKVAKEEAAFAE